MEIFISIVGKTSFSLEGCSPLYPICQFLNPAPAKAGAVRSRFQTTNIFGTVLIYFKNLGLGLFYKKNKNTNLFANYNKGYNSAESSGSISLSPFTSPFFGLLGGRLVFNGEVKVRAEAYHLGMERRQNRFIYRFGMQYIPLKLEGYLTTAQRFLFGTVEKNKKTEYLPITKSEIKTISLGLGYRINDNLKIDYGLGQIIPKFTKRTKEKEDLREATKGRVRGGTLHLLSLSYYF